MATTGDAKLEGSRGLSQVFKGFAFCAMASLPNGHRKPSKQPYISPTKGTSKPPYIQRETSENRQEESFTERSRSGFIAIDIAQVATCKGRRVEALL
eukprot:6161895-Amphidinium_carterae.1